MFEKIIHEYQSDITNYCRMLTGTPWDSGDLYQETFTKAFLHQEKINNHPNPKAYLLKIASNTWTDICRKRKKDIKFGDEEKYVPSIKDDDHIIMDELIYEFASTLPPKQAVVILLVKYFNYSLKETAEIMDSTTGSIKALLHRGRENIAKSNQKETRIKTPKQLIDAFQKAIRNGEPRLISKAYKSMVRIGLHVQFSTRNKYFTIHDPEGNVLGIIKK
jgi:RNA polymerase sigma factor (sigma-70 family)